MSKLWIIPLALVSVVSLLFWGGFYAALANGMADSINGVQAEQVQEAEQGNGFRYERSVFVNACTAVEKDTEYVGFMNSYCGCVYDSGYSQYGDRFTAMVMTIESANVAPEAEAIVNACIANATDQI